MKANELRIGNLIESRTCHHVIVNWGTLRAISNGERTYKPIPLTEEWLVKLKFNKDFTGWQNKGIRLYFDDILNSIVLDTDGCDYLNQVKIQYVHQLQNLYFALTGEELTL